MLTVSWFKRCSNHDTLRPLPTQGMWAGPCDCCDYHAVGWGVGCGMGRWTETLKTCALRCILLIFFAQVSFCFVCFILRTNILLPLISFKNILTTGLTSDEYTTRWRSWIGSSTWQGWGVTSTRTEVPKKHFGLTTWSGCARWMHQLALCHTLRAYVIFLLDIQVPCRLDIAKPCVHSNLVKHMYISFILAGLGWRPLQSGLPWSRLLDHGHQCCCWCCGCGCFFSW